jgi:hypothetical protein
MVARPARARSRAPGAPAAAAAPAPRAGSIGAPSRFGSVGCVQSLLSLAPAAARTGRQLGRGERARAGISQVILVSVGVLLFVVGLWGAVARDWRTKSCSSRRHRVELLCSIPRAPTPGPLAPHQHNTTTPSNALSLNEPQRAPHTRGQQQQHTTRAPALSPSCARPRARAPRAPPLLFLSTTPPCLRHARHGDRHVRRATQDVR